MCVGKMSLTLPVEDFLQLVEMIDKVMPHIDLTGSGQYDPQSRLAPPQKVISPFLN